MIARHFAANFVNFLIVIFLVIASLIYWAKNQYQDEGPLKSDISFEVKKGDTYLQNDKMHQSQKKLSWLVTNFYQHAEQFDSIDREELVN